MRVGRGKGMEMDGETYGGRWRLFMTHQSRSNSCGDFSIHVVHFGDARILGGRLAISLSSSSPLGSLFTAEFFRPDGFAEKEEEEEDSRSEVAGWASFFLYTPGSTKGP